MMHTYVKQILELIDDRIAEIDEQGQKLVPKTPEYYLLRGAQDELHAIENDIYKMFGES